MARIGSTRLAAGFRRFGTTTALIAALGLTAACDTAEERAEKHYEAGLELLEKGDYERALVEFRNVFKLNGQHKDARLTYARVQRERGFAQQAYSQYLRLVEQYPDNLEGRKALSEMALAQRNWEEVERHSSRAIELDPDDLTLQSIDNIMAYFNAAQDKNEDGLQAAITKAQALIEQDPSLNSSREIVIDDLIRRKDWYAALDVIDDGLKINPEDKSLYRFRLGVLQQIGDVNAIEQQLRDLIDRFPDERDQYKTGLIQYYISQKKFDEAESFLREQASLADATTEDRGGLIGFIERFRGPEPAMAQIEEFIALNDEDQKLYRSLRASLNFSGGNQAEAIAEMEEILKDAERTPETRGFEVSLARMLFAENNPVGARSLVEKVLSEDRSQPSAIKLKANWLIEDDETGDAIVMLRDALSLTPNDADLMTLMAKAHEREGNRDLMLEMLTLAVQSSNNAPEESMRYARVLISDDKLRAAESVLIDALRVRPGNMTLLFELGNIYVKMKDWGRTDGVIQALNNLDTPQATGRATELTARKLSGQQRGEDLQAMLEDLAKDPATAGNVRLALLRTRIVSEGAEAGLAYLEELLEETPEDSSLRFVKAGLKADLGEVDEAETLLRDLVNESPDRANVWMALYRLMAQKGDQAATKALLNEALEALPTNGNLLWAMASEEEREGNIEGAISIYERLYEQSSNSLVVANNLASLLSTYRDDADSLNRAFTVARRLRNSDVPAFQDTYGWITFRRGNPEEALPYLETAAEKLPNEHSVQYHYGSVLAALGRTDAALERFKLAQDLVAKLPKLPPYADKIQNEIARLTSGGAAQD